jgi:hypothetical protein
MAGKVERAGARLRHGTSHIYGATATRAGDLPSQHRELMSQHQNLDVFGAIGPAEQNQPAERSRAKIRYSTTSWTAAGVKGFPSRRFASSPQPRSSFPDRRIGQQVTERQNFGFFPALSLPTNRSHRRRGDRRTARSKPRLISSGTA